MRSSQSKAVRRSRTPRCMWLSVIDQHPGNVCHEHGAEWTPQSLFGERTNIGQLHVRAQTAQPKWRNHSTYAAAAGLKYNHWLNGARLNTTQTSPQMVAQWGRLRAARS